MGFLELVSSQTQPQILRLFDGLTFNYQRIAYQPTYGSRKLIRLEKVKLFTLQQQAHPPALSRPCPNIPAWSHLIDTRVQYLQQGNSHLYPAHTLPTWSAACCSKRAFMQNHTLATASRLGQPPLRQQRGYQSGSPSPWVDGAVRHT